MCLARHLNRRHDAHWQTRVAPPSIDDPDWVEFAGITATPPADV
jgi:hypothetical protein